ncbi:hypothetical protein CKY10_12075 [Photorhabdus sp. HUG-39]|uniref:Cro/Cl family transcriptional regulator n=1 Tax=Photorhabdus kayaii TaxID=230088 RepID=A0ABX0B9W2_9GAMM|nr:MULTISPECIES: Cro/CI family transcriptional regulator [Photorhabdus]MCC8376773.1 hypothetical protein [Photorhabdus bodei]NDL14572.1 hypothetical protein [Photorhabdus kayaii]NDL28019.1 hypothetical protein [Photorhabdus kayaii]RAX09414.1 hypothetical protein CKY10_12075 [Photorhabdus sp. HUG-39]
MRTIPLSEYVLEKGQAKAADEIGCHQTAVSKALRTGRSIYVIQLPDGRVKAEEIKPFPNQVSK